MHFFKQSIFLSWCLGHSIYVYFCRCQNEQGSCSLLKGAEPFRAEMHLSRAHIISLLHIYKCVVLVEQQHESASSLWAS